ncbi:MAG: hypothetical protein ACTSX4_05240, partial [Candidatus Helarchaeota archaeon]
MDLLISIYLLITTIVFGISCRKRKDLMRWWAGLVVWTIGAFIIYLQIYNPDYRLVGELIYVSALIFFIIEVFYEYNLIIVRPKKRKKSQRKNYLFSSSIVILLISNSIDLSIVVFESLLVTMALVASIMLILIYFKEKTITRLFMAFALIIGSISGTATILEMFSIPYAAEVNFVANFIYITFMFIIGLSVPIEDRINSSEKTKSELKDRFSHNLGNSLQGVYLSVELLRKKGDMEDEKRIEYADM